MLLAWILNQTQYLNKYQQSWAVVSVLSLLIGILLFMLLAKVGEMECEKRQLRYLLRLIIPVLLVIGILSMGMVRIIRSYNEPDELYAEYLIRIHKQSVKNTNE